MSDVNNLDTARLLWEDDCTLPAIPKPYWRLVRRLSSLRADILARLLRSEELTRLSNAITCRTTNLAATIRALRRVYRWPILTRHIDFLSPDGRRLRIAAYSFDPTKIEETMRRGGDKFCLLVEAWRNRPSMRGAA
jgi:hypothetical protein